MSSSDQIRSLSSEIRAHDRTTPRFNVVVCGTPARIATFARACLRLSSFRPPAEEAPSVPVPHAIALMPLGDALELYVYALPLVPAYAPLWPLTLSAAHVVVRIDLAASRLLDEACAISGKRVIAATTLVPAFAEDDEDAVGALVTAAVEKTVR